MFFCNDTYRDQTLGAKYPWAIGRPAREVWAEIWNVIGPRIAHALATSEATYDEGLLLFLERSGYSEETYHSFSYSAAPGEADTVGGMFCVVVEETDRVIGQRRIAFLGRLASGPSTVPSSASVFSARSDGAGRGSIFTVRLPRTEAFAREEIPATPAAPLPRRRAPTGPDRGRQRRCR